MRRLLCAFAVLVAGVAGLTGCADPPEDEPPPNFFGGPNQGDNEQNSDDVPHNEQNSDAERCDPQVACRDYCNHKHVHCLDENCGGIGGFGTSEYQLCMSGLDTENDEGQRETFLEGCLERVGDDEEACEATEEQAEVYAEQPCDSDEQIHRQCNDLRLFLTGQGEAVYSACGCTPASTAESCSEDEDCDAYGDGLCLEEDGRSVCTAACHDFDGDPPGPILPDPSCGLGQGICLEAGQTFGDDASSICQRYCTDIDDCPQGASCAPVFELQNGNSLGLCTRGVLWDLDFQLCQDDGDCPGGTACREGTCQPSCSGNDIPCDVGPCGDDGYCTVEFEELF